MTTTVNPTELIQCLSPDHFEEIIIQSAINPDVATARGYRTLYGTEDDRAELTALGFTRGVVQAEEAYPALLIPLYRATGEIVSYQLKPATPRCLPNGDGKTREIKYENPKGSVNHIDVPKYTQDCLQNPDKPLWITEGMKKVDSLASQGRASIGLTGVFNWRRKLGTLGDWEDIPIKGRHIIICFDADAKTNRNVQLAMRRLGAWLESKGAATVNYLIVPEEVNGDSVKGVDDFFAAGGTVEALKDAATKVPPGEGPKDASFTDAVLAEVVAEDELEGSFCWSRGIGWLKWNGHVWDEVAETQPTECVRAWALAQCQKAMAEGMKDPSRYPAEVINGWRSVLSRSRIASLVSLSKGIVEKDPTHFDSDPDLLCVQNGYVDLSTGKLHDPDPDKLMTKSAGCSYAHDAHHELWNKALEAVPEEVREWFWDRIGQSATGHMTPDDVMVVAHGDGENGKSTIVAAIKGVLGSYAGLLSDRALMANPDAHPTELMDLRGLRYAILEETPEARRLDVHRLKRIVGTEEITARRMKQDSVTFKATHSLFVNTNFKPVVSETDHGTWRRLALLSFPYTYRKPGAPLYGPNERHGDPLLRQRFAHPSERLSQAVLSWVVEGARRWYERGRLMLPTPERVEKDSLKWRSETDLILGFVQEALKFVADGKTPAKELCNTFNEWIEGQHHKPWTDKTFSARFGAHDMVKQNRVEKKRMWLNGKGSTFATVWHGVVLRNPGSGGQNGTEWDIDPDIDSSLSAHERIWEHDEQSVPVIPRLNPPRVVNKSDCSPCSPADERGCLDNSDRGSPRTTSSDLDEGVENPVHPVPTPDQDHRASGRVLQNEEKRTEEEEMKIFEELTFEEVKSDEQPSPILGQARGATGFDLETRGTDWLRWPKRGPRPFITLAGWGGRVDASPEALCAALSASGGWVGHHVLGFDVLALARHTGLSLASLAGRVRDTELQAMLADPPTSKETKHGPNFKSYSLDAVLERTLGIRKDERGKLLAKKYGGWTNIDPRDPDYQAYCAEDVAQVEKLHSALPWTPYMEREMKVQTVMSQMTLNGFRIDGELLDQRIKEGEERKERAANTLTQWGLPLGSKNPLSTNVGQAWLKGIYEHFGVKHPPMTKKGNRLATSVEQLRVISDHPKCPAELKQIIGLMGVITSERTIYGTIKEQMINGRVHADIWPRQASGRWSAGFFTTMGKRGERVHERAVFLPEEGHVLVAVDLGQIDARVIAAHAQDPNYLALFAPGEDIHENIALQIFGSKAFRQDAKALGHGANYGMGEKRMIADGHDPVKVRAFFRGRAQNFPRLIEWTDEVREMGKTGQLLDNGFGRPLKVEKERAWTQSPAQVGQGGTRDMMAEGLLKLVETAPEVLPMLRGIVHDEIVASVPVDQFEDVSRAIVSAFECDWAPEGKKLTVPVIAGASKPGVNWADCYEK